MTWSGVWSYKVDGTQLNDHVKYITFVPEIDNIQQRRTVLQEVDGDYPVFIRSQPQEGTYTFLIACKNAGNEVTWNARITEIKALFDPSSTHTFTCQARGMPTAKSTTVITEAVTPDYRTRTITVACLAPTPVLA